MDPNALVTGKDPALMLRYRSALSQLGFVVDPLPLDRPVAQPFSVAIIDARSEDALPRLRTLAGRGLILAVTSKGQEVFLYRNGADEVLLDDVPQLEALARAINAGAQRLGRPVDGPYSAIIGRSPPILRVLQLVEHYGGTDATVLLRGETGTGKEVFARSIHHRSPRRKGPFVALNCAAIPETLIESELFGHARGAFTGAVQARGGSIAAAEGGTLFLDEISELTPAAQAKLLRVLQEREYTPVGESQARRADVRIVTATNRRLEDEVARGRFRSDLYWRLEVVTIELPPLRNRSIDILPLCNHFIDRTNAQHQRSVSGVGPLAQQLLLAHTWPGNVREMENTVERAVILRSQGILQPDDIELRRPKAPLLFDGVRLPEDGLDLATAVAALERILIEQALEQSNGNKSQAARLLNINRTTLGEKLRTLRGGQRG